jgi:hypothetical protein
LSIWFFLWLVLSAALLYFLGWTLYILYRQKQAWKVYAAARKLRYSATSLLASPEMSGIINNYTVSLFTGEHTSLDGRNTRKLTAIEVALSSRMPFEAGVGSGGMVPVVRSLGLKEEYAPAHPAWDKAWIAVTNSPGAMEVYLTPARVEALMSLMKMKQAWTVFVFRENVTLLRIDTPDALENPKNIDQLVKKMTDVAQVLELKVGEDTALKNALNRPARKSVAPTASTRAVNLELESEELSPPLINENE